MTEEKEPDSTPLTRQHVEKFLAWYRQRNGTRPFPGEADWWTNALHTLTLGDLRNGMRALQRFSKTTALEPPQFWSLCKSRADEKSIERFNAMRRKLKGG